MVDACVLSCCKFLVPFSTAEAQEEKRLDDSDSFVMVEEKCEFGVVRLRVGRNMNLSAALSGFNDVMELYGVEDLSITLASLDSILLTYVEQKPNDISINNC